MRTNKLFFFAAFVLLVASVQATDRTQFYDYSNNGNNVTAANNGAVYNVTEASKSGLFGYTFDGSDDYLTITPGAGANGLCAFTSTSNRTVAVQLELKPLQGAGGTFFKECFGGDSGRKYGVIQATSRVILTYGAGTLQSSNTSQLLTYNQPFWVVFQTYGNNTSVMWVNGTMVANASGGGANANISATDNSTIGAENGGASRFNGTVLQVVVFNRVISNAEMNNITNGSQFGIMPANTLNLTAWYPFFNTTTINATINSTALIRSAPTNFLGMQAEGDAYVANQWCDPAGTGSRTTYCNQTEYQTYFNYTSFGSGYGAIRMTFDLSNRIATFNPATGAITFMKDLGAGETNDNILFPQDAVRQASRAGKYVVFNIDGTMANMLADNTSGCNYGSDENERRGCRPITNGSYVQGIRLQTKLQALSLIEYGCFNYTSGVCAVGGPNEYYLSIFFQGNTTAVPQSGTCSVRQKQVIDMWEDGLAPSYLDDALEELGYNSSWIRYVSTPAFYNDNSCSDAIAANFTTRNPYGSTYGADMFDTHTYVYGCSGVVASYKADAIEEQALAAAGNYTGRQVRSEGSIDCEPLGNINVTQYQSNMMSSAMFVANSTNLSEWILYKASSITTQTEEDTEGFYTILFRGTNLTKPSQYPFNGTTNDNVTLTGAYHMLKVYNTIPEGTSMYPCVGTAITSMKCIYYKQNTTNGYILVNNELPQNIDIDNVTITGINISSAVRMTQGMSSKINTSVTVTGGSVDLGIISAWGSAVYAVNINTDNVTNISATYTPSTYLVNITEPNDQTFSFSLTNPSGQQYNAVWQNSTGGAPITACANLTSCTRTGSYSSAGQYNWTVTITGETNTLTKVWLLQINNTPQNVSATYSPSSPTTMYINTVQAFTTSLTNPDNVPRTSTWRLDGVNQTACFNATVCNLTLGAAGTYALNVTIVASTNTVSNLWSITVSSVNPVIPTACADTTAGFVAGIGFLAVMIAVVFFGGIMFLIKAVKDKSFGSVSSPVDWIQENITGVAVVGLLLALGVIIISLVAGQC